MVCIEGLLFEILYRNSKSINKNMVQDVSAEMIRQYACIIRSIDCRIAKLIKKTNNKQLINIILSCKIESSFFVKK